MRTIIIFLLALCLYTSCSSTTDSYPITDTECMEYYGYDNGWDIMEYEGEWE